jgi:hypothetical protein
MVDEPTIDKWLDARRNSYVEVIIAGRIFGGRHGESPQQPTAYSVCGNRVTIQFGTTERLVITDPSAFSTGNDGQLIVFTASHVSWGWHYYGRPQTVDNWCVESFAVAGVSITLERTGPLMPGTERFQFNGSHLVELL